MKTIYKKIVALLLICTIISCAFQTSLFAVEFIENVSSITKASNYFEADEIIPNPNYVPTQNQTDVNSVNSNGSIANGVYRIKNVYNGKYVDTNGGGTSAGTALVQWDKSEFINGNPDVPNRNQLFKITYLLTVNGLDYYSIRPMRNNGMGVSAPITGTVRNATIQSIPTTDYYNSISNLQRWAITKNGSYYTIKNGASSINSFLATPANTVNGSNIITSTDSVTNNSKWILEPFTGGELYGTAMTNFTNTVAVGKTFTYQAVMYSSTTGHNGPVTYSVRNPNGTATDKATINSTTGELTALKEGSIQVVTSYPNAPYLWLWNVEIQFEEGSYFIQNRQTEKYMQPDNNGGNFMEQHSFDGANDQRWSILYDEDYGYYKIRNLNSGLYLTVQNNTNTDENIIEQPFLSSTADRQLWRFTKISDNTYKIQAKSHEGTDLVIALGAGIESANGINIEQRDYADDGNYKDEWVLEKAIYGSQVYRELSSSQIRIINCHGYAMMRTDWPEDWTTNTTAYLATVTPNLSLGSNDYSSTIRNTVSQKTKLDFENWLTSNGYTWAYESSFTGNGENTSLAGNQYRVVLRTGFHNMIVSGAIDAVYDYHFWYQTYNGRWANKHGAGPTELLPSGTTPFTEGSSGWTFGNYTDFYDGTIYSYIITIN